MDLLFIPIDSRGAAIPYIDIGHQIAKRGHGSIVYVTQDLEEQVEAYAGQSIIDPFNLKDFITGHRIYETATNTFGLFVAARNVMNAWIPSAMNSIYQNLDNLDPANTIVISNTVGLMYLGHFMLELGFKHLYAMDPYRMLDWKDRWSKDTSQFFPSLLPNTLLLRGLFAQQGKALGEKFLGHPIKSNYNDINAATLDQVLMYSPQLSKDADIASGYPYPIKETDKGLTQEIADFIKKKKSEDKLLFVFTLGSMDIKHSEKRHLIHEFLDGVSQLNASAIVLGWQEANDFDDILFIDYFVRYNALFPHADMIVEHCGAGTTHLALWSGKPVFAIPFLRDQYDWAAQLDALGMLVGYVAKSKFSTEEFVSKFKQNYHSKTIEAARQAGEQERTIHNNAAQDIAIHLLNMVHSLSVT